MSLTPEQVQIVRSTVPVLQAHGNDITTVFYRTLLDEIPELHNIFNTANQANGLQPRALAGSLYAYASHIDDLGALSPAVEKICQKHASLYVRPEHYKIVGEYLLRAMGDVLGAALTKDVLNAWEAAYWQLANILISKENSIMEETNGWTDWRDFRIAKKIKESDEITSFYLEPVDAKKLPSYKPGQYISVMTTVPQLNYLQPRQYSLSDAPSPSHFRISVKRESGIPTSNPTAVVHPGYISNVLHDERKEGDILSVSHPAGDFFLDAEGADKDASSIVLISAGVGVTPMISILNSLLSPDNNSQEKQRPRISFIHGSRNTSTQAFASHIASLASQHANFTSTTFLSSPDEAKDLQGQHYQHAGRMDLGALDAQRELCLSDEGARYFVCGPEGFMVDVKKWLVGKGVGEGKVKMEVFGTGEIGQSS